MSFAPIGAALAAALALGFAAPAFAHASISPSDVVNFSKVRAVITLEHGCDGAPTTEVIVTIPEGFVSAQPVERNGWESSTVTGQYAATYHVDGADVSSGAVEIRWSGGSAPDGRPARFMFEGTMQSFNDQTLFVFPVTQLCGAEGKKVVWDELVPYGADPHSVDHPAPTMSVSFEAITGESDPVANSDIAILGGLEISGAFTRATLPNAPVGGGYLSIANTGTEADRLVSASSPVAGLAQLHQMQLEGDVMKMGELSEGVAILPGETVALAPGGLHIMLMDLTQPLVEGETVPLTLTFEKAGTIEIMLPVAGAAADAPATEHAHGHGG